MSTPAHLGTRKADTPRVNIYVDESAPFREFLARLTDDAGEPLAASKFEVYLDVATEADEEIVLECSLSDGRLLYDEETGELHVVLGGDEGLEIGEYVYDCVVLLDGASAAYLCAGAFVVQDRVTVAR